jgi:hypothetical protein
MDHFKHGRLGYTETTLLFYYYMRFNVKIEPTKELIKFEGHFLNFLFKTSGYYDVSYDVSNISFDETNEYIYTENYKKLMNEFFQMSKNSNFTQLLIHYDITRHLGFMNHLQIFNENFNVINYNFDNTLNQLKSFIKDKNVLIINPMSILMKKQYDSGNIHKINEFPSVKSIQYYSNEYTFFNKLFDKSDSKNNSNNSNSFDYVDNILSEINTIEFDCVIISCGAISSLIANRINKDYFIIGSDLLTIFGIKHERIKNSNLYNEYWIDVTEELKPHNYKLIENGCYW